MAQIIDGKKISQQIKDEVKEEVSRLKEEGVEVTLAVIQVGSDPASSVYVGNKKKACEYTGIRSLAYELQGKMVLNTRNTDIRYFVLSHTKCCVSISFNKGYGSAVFLWES